MSEKWYDETKYIKIKEIFKNKKDFSRFIISQTQYSSLSANILEWINNKKLSEIPIYGDTCSFKRIDTKYYCSNITEKEIEYNAKAYITINDLLYYLNNDFFMTIILIHFWYKNELPSV